MEGSNEDERDSHPFNESIETPSESATMLRSKEERIQRLQIIRQEMEPTPGVDFETLTSDAVRKTYLRFVEKDDSSPVFVEPNKRWKQYVDLVLFGILVAAGLLYAIYCIQSS